jgi:hypothetical protein
VDELAPQGYRPITLGVSGDPGSARYAAVWVQRQGPAFQMMHRIDAAEYQRRFDLFTSQGYAPTVFSATGPVENAEFAAVFEQGETRPWFARHGLRWDPDTDPDTITHENARAFNDGFMPRVLAVGLGSARHGLTAAEYQQEFNTSVAAGMIPVCVQAGGEGRQANGAYHSVGFRVAAAVR